MENEACVSVYDVEGGGFDPTRDDGNGGEVDWDDVKGSPVITIPLNRDVKATNVEFLTLNKSLFVTFDDGSIRLYDHRTGECTREFSAHGKKINRVKFNRDKTMFITSSADFTSKLYDAVDMEHLKTYKTDRPVNAAVMHPTREHILLGGGQEAMSVTTTGSRSGKFETKFFHSVYQTEFGIVKGHFGPINAIDVNPDGKSYASGAEDGYIRLHFFDEDYWRDNDPVPEEE